MLLFALLYSLLLWPAVVSAAFGYTDDGTNYVIDSGASLVIKVSKCCGDIVSLAYNGVEYQGYDGKNTQVESGLGDSTVSIQQYSSPAYIIKVSVTHGTLKHYLFVRYGNNNVYIFTNKADASVTVSRYIVRFKGGIFPHSTTDADYYDDGSTYIEASDVMKDSNGYTESKHYCGNTYGRTIDYDYVGKTTGSVGLWMIRSNHEKASGGPFFRSLVRRGSSTGEDLYDIYHYNMGHTDPERFGLQGPSVLAFTDGGTPNSALFARNADWSWFDTLGIDGWVPSSGRGRVAGVGLSNMKSGYTYVVGLKNTAAQYWGTAASSGGAWSITKVLPGTYTLTVYKSELEVYTGSVTITAGAGTAVNTITCTDPADATAIWRIGDWDGTPKGFVNFADTPMKPTYMHPSDTRLASWDPSNYIVGTSTASSFPGYIWQDVNNNHIVYFKLTAAQLTTSHTIRIGITEGYIGGRPTITVNDWASALPAATTQASTRSLTVGTYRGNNAMLTFTVPASAWVQSTSSWQVLTITVITGSTGSGYLSGGISVDAVDMI
ncbi:rhamnogalacturonan lyase [Pseudomassariella vexata]|uniref:rhamnogalacturonan endolyase n=1 Tax=Pseudomassariella vexata TaxID=1141098 RepID=A0A1Y2DA03_9PEZI|nr:rhamnogalacturonan lyase [Pseudomassariella vexata]ORY55495.1 rhamnogalacturonan lyase [Pseudomassariella vexata]